MEDQITCSFCFKITPTQIIPNAKSKQPQSQSVLIKLGNREAKCKSVGSPIELNVDVLYSKTLNKYCPIKGIIKVYDINVDGSEIISCVGAFNTEDLLCHHHKVSNVERDIGLCKIYLTFEVTRKDSEHEESKESSSFNSEQKSTLKEPAKKNGKVKISEKSLKGEQICRFSKSPNLEESECHETSYLIDNSSTEDQRFQLSISDEFKTNEREIMEKELVEERRRIKELEEKLSKSQIKIELMTKSIAQKNNEMKSYYKNFQNFIANLESDSKGKYELRISEKSREICLKYKVGVNSKEIFEGFVEFMIKKMTESGEIIENDETIEETEINKMLPKLENLDFEKKRSLEEIEKIRSELNIKKQEVSEKSALLTSKNQILKRKEELIQELEQNVKKILQQKHDLEAENQYLRDSYHQMELGLNSKESLIESLEKIISKNNSDIYFLAEKNKKHMNDSNNLNLKLEEMQEEHENLQETIDGYRKQFGDLKSAKDKALEREIKECLRWIDQQDRDEELSFQEETALTFEETANVGPFMKSLDEIEKMPQGDIELIRNEVMSVLKKLDELVAKNSFVGSS